MEGVKDIPISASMNEPFALTSAGIGTGRKRKSHDAMGQHKAKQQLKTVSGTQIQLGCRMRNGQ